MAGFFLTACIVLAAAQAMAAALCVLLLLTLIFGLFTAPKETLGLVGLLLVAGMFETYPLIFLAVVALLVAVRLWLTNR